MTTSHPDMNRPNPRRSESRLIHLAPVANGSGGPGSLVLRWGLIALGTAAVLVLLALVVRLLSMLLLRDTIGQNIEDLARVGGVDPYTTGRLASILSLILAVPLLGIVVRLLAGFLLPGRGVVKMTKGLVAGIGLAFLAAVGPGILMHARGVGIDGLPRVMVELDPAEAGPWFDPDGVALIYYADHFDGTRRYWNRAGHTPFDRTVSKPATEEVAEQFHREQRRRQIDEELRQIQEQAEQAKREVEERRQAEAAATASSLRIVDPPASPAVAAPAVATPSAPRHLTVDEFFALHGIRETPAPTAPAPPAPKPAPTPDHRLELLPGRTLELRLDRRAAEIVTDGTVELTRPGFTGTIVLGAGSPRVFSESELIHVRVVGRRGVVLHLRWLDARPDRRLPMAAYRGQVAAPSAPASPSPHPVAVVPPAAPPAQRFPLPLGQVFRLEIGGDTVEVWSDGPFHLAAGANGAVSEVRSGQRMRISGADFFVASPSAPEARWLHVQTVAPSPRRVAAEVAAQARR